MNGLGIAVILYTLYVHNPIKQVHLNIYDPSRHFRNPSREYAAMSTQEHSIGVTSMIL